MTATLPDAPAISSSAVASRFVWHDLMSTDRERALRFYQDLFGWTLRTLDMGEMGEYRMLHAGDAPFGGAVPLEAEAGLPSHWISYVACDDVDVVAARAEAEGGTVPYPPMDIPDVGRFAVVVDPQGAAFSPLRLLPGTPAAPDAPAGGLVPLGCPIWNELATSDPEAAATFYARLFGWGIEQMPMESGGTYTLLGRGEGTPHAGGVFRKPELIPVPAWLVYFRVADAAATAARTDELGGRVLVPAFPVPGVGQVAWLQDPSGAVFAVLEPSWG